MHYADFFRVAYAILAVVCSTGFVTTLVVRWDLYHLGERIIRSGLIGQHLILSYGGYIALKNDLPPSAVGALLTASLAIILCGFLVWWVDARFLPMQPAPQVRSDGYTQPMSKHRKLNPVPAWRAHIYELGLAFLGLLQLYGVLDEKESLHWTAILIPVLLMARANVPGREAPIEVEDHGAAG